MPIKLHPFFSFISFKPYNLLFIFLVVQIFACAQVKKDSASYITGIASWYSDSFQGRKTASGEIFSQKKFTCASNRYKLGTWLRIINIHNGKSVVVKVNDRMSPKTKRIVDITRVAAKQIGILGVGLTKVKVENLGQKDSITKN